MSPPAAYPAFSEMLREGVFLTRALACLRSASFRRNSTWRRSSLRQALTCSRLMGIITPKVAIRQLPEQGTPVAGVLAVPMEFLFLLDDTSVWG